MKMEIFSLEFLENQRCKQMYQVFLFFVFLNYKELYKLRGYHFTIIIVVVIILTIILLLYMRAEDTKIAAITSIQSSYQVWLFPA